MTLKNTTNNFLKKIKNQKQTIKKAKVCIVLVYLKNKKKKYCEMTNICYLCLNHYKTHSKFGLAKCRSKRVSTSYGKIIP